MQAPKFSRRSFLKSGAVAAAAASLPGFSLPAAAAAAPIGTVCQTQHGPVQGIRQEGHLVWYGIPYGASTAGDARWTAPQDPAPWADAKDCTVPGAAAYQYSTCALGTEDCLKLDVYTTEKASKRPVIVYLHSGGNQIGSARELPGGFLAEQLGCVFVGLEYRLGLFGFNCLPAFCSGPEETGNFALLDMAKALDWVRDNIASFGGDPQNITVLGFAAGGRDGMALLASPLFVGRFQKAISISGGMTCADENTSAETLAAALAPLAVQDGKALTEAAARRWLLTEDPAVRSWLCGVDAARLAPLMANAGLRMSVFPHLYADGITLPEGGYPAAPYSEIPTLLLTGADEFNAAARWDSWFSSEEAKRFSADELEAAKQFAATYGSALCRVFSTRGSAEVIAARSDAPLYLGQIEYGSSASKTQIPLLGSFQGIALPMLSGSNPYSGWADLSGAGYQAMAEQLRAYLKNFITSGDPNGKKLLSGSTRWQRWTPDSPALLVLDADADHATRPVRRPDGNERIAACRHGGGQHPLSRPETGRDQKRAQGQILRLSIAVFPFSANKKHRSAERCFFVYWKYSWARRAAWLMQSRSSSSVSNFLLGLR